MFSNIILKCLLLVGTLLSTSLYSQNINLPKKWLELSTLTGKNPELEFKRVKALLKKKNSKEICKIPAKVKFIAEQLGLSSKELLKSCTQYQKWIDFGSIDSISILFASGYLGNPASYFGHPLIKFNSKKSKSYLLDTAINYGALTSGKENPFLYVLKGLFGGYDASFTRANFFYHHHEYTEVELRDVWDYKLALSVEEVEYFVDLVYELNGYKRDYFFVSDNCAYRISEVIEHVTGKKILPDYYIPHAIPVKLFHSLKDHNLIENINFIPSRKSKIQTLYGKLSKSEFKTIQAIISTEAVNISTQLLNTQKKDLILQLLVEYYGYLAIKNYPSKKYDLIKKRVLRYIIEQERDIEQVGDFKNDLKKAPHFSEKPKLIRLGLNYSKQISADFTFRPTLYDSLNQNFTKPIGNELEALKFNFRISPKQVRLRDFTLLSIASITPNKIELPGMTGLSWKVKINYLTDLNFCESCNLWRLSTGFGNAISKSNFLIYYMLDLSVQESYKNSGNILIGPEVGFFYDTYKKWSFMLSLKEDFNFNSQSYFSSQFEARYARTLDRDIRFKLLYNSSLETSLNYSFYF